MTTSASVRYYGRPKIDLVDGVVVHVCAGITEKARVVLRKSTISVACTDVTPEALRYILNEYEKAFPEGREVVLQNGETA